MKIKYILLFSALVISFTAAFFSIFGLSQLFAGANIAVIIMATGLEIAKIITTTALHIYWSKTSTLLKTYLTISIIILMFITSAGIYGFLSNAYQKTANKLELQNGKISVLTGKKDLIQKNIDDNNKIIEQKNKRVDQLSNLRVNQELRLDAAKNNYNKNSVTGDISTSNDEIQKLTNDIDILNLKNTYLFDSISKYNSFILQLNTNSELAGEVGPLKYISEITGAPMPKVVNVLILLLIFVFDPLAIALVLMTNRVFQIEDENNDLKPKDVLEDKINIKEEPKEELVTSLIENNEEFIEEPILEDEQHEDDIELTKERIPVVPTGKVQLEDIKEVKDRGYSVNIPQPKNNTIERIGSNKVVKNGDNNKVIFKRN